MGEEVTIRTECFPPQVAHHQPRVECLQVALFGQLLHLVQGRKLQGLRWLPHVWDASAKMEMGG